MTGRGFVSIARLDVLSLRGEVSYSSLVRCVTNIFLFMTRL